MHITAAMNQIETCSYSVQPLGVMYLCLVVDVEFRGLAHAKQVLYQHSTSRLFTYLFVCFYAGFHCVAQIGLDLPGFFVSKASQVLQLEVLTTMLGYRGEKLGH